ncbi:MAG: hypothetical protein ACTHZI_08505 [Luteimonas sp.]
MIEAIQVAGLDATAGAAGGAGASAQPQASAIEVRDFAQAQLRAAGVSQPPQATGAEAVSGAAEVEQSQGTQMMISAFDNLNSSAKEIESLSEAMSGATGDLTPSQMLEMTMLSHKFLFQSQLTSNVANRTSDGVQQLFRQQS